MRPLALSRPEGLHQQIGPAIGQTGLYALANLHLCRPCEGLSRFIL